ncbi:hypothetical protein FBUS_09737 [Fasciolopsis buskii]|uniref:TLC domain-containing protein n=1 Tax=Fasciolopsis buskii TaxID=27845 RepID=A0A8E0RMW8_9TREM|nr:hypothetical protein FBUS_09737 [Fasciolopsis buski]
METNRVYQIIKNANDIIYITFSFQMELNNPCIINLHQLHRYTGALSESLARSHVVKSLVLGPVSSSNYASEMVMSISTGYMLYDAATMPMYSSGKELIMYLVHHGVTILGSTIIVVSKLQFCSFRVHGSLEAFTCFSN